jgi:hypothetical protein
MLLGIRSLVLDDHYIRQRSEQREAVYGYKHLNSIRCSLKIYGSWLVLPCRLVEYSTALYVAGVFRGIL